METSIFQIERIEEIEKNILSCSISLNADHPIYQGHFPSDPITPGVVFFQALKQILEINLNKKLLMTEVKKAKFLEITRPKISDSLIFNINFRLNNGAFDVKNKTTFTNHTVLFNCNATFVEMTNR
ncbi:hypothetical protein [Aegicerativicinus sediminis]|uniref:hypothetical protein n=1 Tax=Aegicerativicinus sediminis TaxID=2893202 RepID=UPI001E36DCE3|nr:hypothetical protein [Aegicerativicinus sediminis]